MTVYVDDMYLASFGRFGRMKMSHLFADSTEELYHMVDLIGVQRKWIQYENTYKEHFDIAIVKRKLAVRFGAVEVSMRFYAQYILYRETGILIDYYR